MANRVRGDCAAGLGFQAGNGDRGLAETTVSVVIAGIHPHPDKGGDEFAKLFAVAKPEGIRFPERLTNGRVASSRSLIGPHE